MLPLLVESSRPAWPSAGWTAPTHASVDVVVPIAFIVPNAGKLLSLLFVPFAAWLAGEPLEAGSYLSCSPRAFPATSPRPRSRCRS